MATGRARRGVVDGTPDSLVPTTDRVLTVPNVLSGLRLLFVPVFCYLLLGPQADGWALAILMVSGWTDYFDGKIARRYGLTSRVGQLLDPLADRLYVVTTLVAFTVRDIVPLWATAAILGRDLCITALLPALRRHGYGPLPVHFLGKAATFNLLYAFPLLLGATFDNVVGTVSRPLGWAFLLWGTGLYWWAGVLYAVQTRHLVRRARTTQTARGAA
ncbi:MAG TPA: CDP-alcohol phosphatidyltransferase family protein [Mycobacteriales bacterium]|nr:CDP-alcohol phosphatidyltransferase family protein [Mycobacteriales bacterium]